MTTPETAPPPQTVPQRGLTGWRAAGILVAYIASQFVVAAAVIIPFAVYYALEDPQRMTQALVAPALVVPASLAGIFVGGWVVLRMTRRSLAALPADDAARLLGLSWGPRADRIRSAILGFAFAALFVIVSVKFVPAQPDQVTGPLSQAAQSGGWLLALVSGFAVLLAPPIEEFLFRGVLFAGFAAAWGRVASATAVTAIFVLFHLGEAHAYWPALVFITLIAIALVVIRMRTGAIGPTVILHSAYNAGLVLASYTLR